MGQSLFGDELFTYADLAGRGARGRRAARRATAGSRTTRRCSTCSPSSPRTSARPRSGCGCRRSLLGAAHGAAALRWRAGSRRARAGLWAAALWVLSPFVLFYGTEGRAYATLAFFVALSTLALLLRAADRAAALVGALRAGAVRRACTRHYTAVFVLAAQAGWALAAHRERAGARCCVATAAAALALRCPGSRRCSSRGATAARAAIGAFYPVNLRSVGEALGAASSAAIPFVAVARPPGPPRASALLVRRRRSSSPSATLRTRGGRLAAGPSLLVRSRSRRRSGSLLYSAVGDRDLRPAQPHRLDPGGLPAWPAGCSLGCPRAAALVAGGLVAAGLLRRARAQPRRRPTSGPTSAAAAAFIDARAGARDPYLETQLYFSDAPELRQRPATCTSSARTPSRGRSPCAVRARLACARSPTAAPGSPPRAGRRLFVVGAAAAEHARPARAARPTLPARVRRVDSRRFHGHLRDRRRGLRARAAQPAVTTSVCVPAPVATVTSTPAVRARGSSASRACRRARPSSTVAPAGSVWPIASFEIGAPTCTRVV